MVTILDFLDNLSRVDINSIVDDIVSENQSKIVNLNRDNQIFQRGEDADGVSLLKYAKSTQSIYDKNPPSDLYGSNKSYQSKYNLFWSGESYKSFIAWVEGSTLFISANQRGQELLTMHGGSRIFGLNKENEEIANYEIIAPEINDKVNNILF